MAVGCDDELASLGRGAHVVLRVEAFLEYENTKRRRMDVVGSKAGRVDADTQL